MSPLLPRKHFQCILDHVFLARKLPNHESTHLVIEEGYLLHSVADIVSSSIYSTAAGEPVTSLFTNWNEMQGLNDATAYTICEALKGLKLGHMFGMYVRAQNAGIFMAPAVTFGRTTSKVTLCTFPSSLPIGTVMSTPYELIGSYPEQSITVPCSELITSFALASHLVTLNVHVFDDVKRISIEERNEVKEVLDPQDTKYISEILVSLLSGADGKADEPFSFICKKIRDNVQWGGGHKPWRRSAMWMTIKVVLQLALVTSLGETIGRLMYKIFLLEFMRTLCQQASSIDDFDSDFGVQMIRKVARRDAKIITFFKRENKNINATYVRLVEKIHESVVGTVEAFQAQMEGRWLEVVKNSIVKLPSLNINESDLKHKLPHIPTWNNHISSASAKNSVSSYNFVRHRLESTQFPKFSDLIRKLGANLSDEFLGNLLFDTERFILQQDRKFKEISMSEYLRDLAYSYISAATSFYEKKEDPLGGSRMILTLLKIIQLLDRVAYRVCPLLLDHGSCINPDVINSILLSTRFELEAAQEIEDYFTYRNEHAKLPGLIDEEVVTENSFAVRFAKRNIRMRKLREEILATAEDDMKFKKGEILGAKNALNAFTSCSCDVIRISNLNYRVEVFEKPLPPEVYNQFAVVFELLAPTQIVCLRDVLSLLMSKVCLDEEMVSSVRSRSQIWTVLPKIRNHMIGKQKHFFLGSTLESSSTKRHPSCSEDLFFVNNRYNCTYVGTYKKTWDVKKWCTLSVEPKSVYSGLQWTLSSTNHNENQVLSKLCECPANLRLEEFKTFGTIRAGHRLQFRNILHAFVSKALSINEESVFALICQSIWEAGPSKGHWSRECHEGLLDPKFVIELLNELEILLKRHQQNWTEAWPLMVIIVITCRIVDFGELINNTRAVALLRECRVSAIEWMEKIEDVKAKEKSEAAVKILQLKLLDAAICVCYTYNIHSAEVVLNTNEDFGNWIGGINRIYNVAYTSVKLSITHNHHLLIRQVQNISLRIEKVLLKFTNAGLTLFVKKNWNDSNDGRFDEWVPRSAPEEQIFETTFHRGSKVNDQQLSTDIYVDILRGLFLINGFPVGFLPESVTQSEIFIRTFHNVVFEVLPAVENQTLVSKHKYNGSSYHFKIIDPNSKDIMVIEMKEEGGITVSEYQLLPIKILEGILPPLLIENHSHWLNLKTKSIEFRDVHLDDFQKNQKPKYIFSLDKMEVKEGDTGRKLVAFKSQSHDDVGKYLDRLELQKFIHIFQQHEEGGGDANPNFIVELPRLSLQFKLDQAKSQLLSLDYNMYVRQQQDFASLIGLQNGLFLESEHQEKKLLIPNGDINILAPGSLLHHQKVTICLSQLEQPAVFVFEVDNILQRLKAGKRLTAWLFLAYLHALTSSPLPDPFTGLTGTESALQILQSGHAWSCQPYDDSQCLEILKKFTTMSPVRAFYPEETQKMETTRWPNELTTSAANEGFCYIVEKLVADSERLTDVFEKCNPKKTESRAGNMLSRRAYFRYKPFCSTQELVSEDFVEIIPTSREVRIGLNGRTWVTAHDSINRIREMSELGIKWQYKKPNPIPSLQKLLVQSFYGGGELPGISNYRNILSLTIPELFFNFILRDNWMNFYELSRHVSSLNLKSEWTFILSLLAFAGHPMEHLNLLQAIAVQPVFFLRHHPPKDDTGNFIRTFPNPCDKSFNITIIVNLVMEPRTLETETAYLLGNIVASHWSSVKYMEACHADDFAGAIEVGLASFVQIALPKINAKLQVWSRNIKLDEFLTGVTEKFPLLPNPPQVSNFNILMKSRVVVGNASRHDINLDEFLLNDVDTVSSEINLFTNAFIYGKFKKNPSEKTMEVQELLNHLTCKIYRYTLLRNSVYGEVKKNMINNQTRALYAAGLLRFTPDVLLQRLTQPPPSPQSPASMLRLWNLIGATGIILTLEQQTQRCMKFYKQGDMGLAHLLRELENPGHEGWSPSENPLWLLFEIEMNLMIRQVQVDVANHMSQPQNGEHSVMQLNMGEGKTAVIVPLLALTLADGNKVCRVTVLRSLFKTNMASLIENLGGLLNRRVYTFPCRRDMNINGGTVSKIQKIYEECQQKRGIVISLPESRLSFQLKGYEKCRGGAVDLEAAKPLVGLQKWIYTNVRDILDESDEILFAKYQLIYTVGNQQQVDGGPMRWIVAQNVLKLIPERMKELEEDKTYGDSCIEVLPDIGIKAEQFQQLRLLKRDPYELLIKRLGEDVLDGKCPDLGLAELFANQRELVLELLTNNEITNEDHTQALSFFNKRDRDIILIIMGYLKYEILGLVLSKRWKVQYGVDLEGEKKMAIPFRAKDVPAKRTEFGHPDVAILLTQLSYYYSGLADKQIEESLDRLSNHIHKEEIYASWMEPVGDRAHPSIRTYNSINLSDLNQKNLFLFPMLRRNTIVIDFWLSNFVFPNESRMFEKKLTCTPWDICGTEYKHPVTGFSGTNDSSNLLPHTIHQNDLQALQDTNQKVREVILLKENDIYFVLSRGVSGLEIISQLVARNIHVLLDPGALILELTNEEVTTKWLEALRLDGNTTKVAAVYYDEFDTLRVKHRDQLNTSTPYELSPYKEKMEACVVYLDDVHTRGTDLKISPKTRACVTLCAGITRDKFVQACMRMRLLGRGHTLAFFASAEAHDGIRAFSSTSSQEFLRNEKTMKIGSTAMMNWICQNSRDFEKKLLPYWASSGLNYIKKTALHYQYAQDGVCENLGNNCCDDEVYGLMEMYGGHRNDMLLTEIQNLQAERLLCFLRQNAKNVDLDCFKIDCNNIIERCVRLLGKTHIISNLLDEEQEKEQEQQQEREEQIERPQPATPATPEISPYVANFIATGMLNLSFAGGDILPLHEAFRQTKLWNILPDSPWCLRNIYVTKDFTRVIDTTNPTDFLDEFLRTPKWILSAASSSREEKRKAPILHMWNLLLLSQFEANELIPNIKVSKAYVGMHMFATRLFPKQLTLINNPNLFITSTGRNKFHNVQPQFLAPLYVFSGTLYFGNKEEQCHYCYFTGLVPRKRTPVEQAAFKEGNIVQGFLAVEVRAKVSPNICAFCSFKKNPQDLVTGIINTRHGLFPQLSHVAKVVLRSRKVESKDF